MSNIAQLKPSEGILEILNPANEKDKLGIRISILSIDDERMKKIKRRISDARIAKEKKGKAFDQAERDHNTRVMLCAAMTGWEWYVPELEPERIIPAVTELKIHDENGIALAKSETIIVKPEQRIPAVMGEQPNWNGDEHPAFSEVNAMAFLELEWAYDQVLEKVGDTKSFFQR